jgi:hypothetical protein
MVSVQFRGAFGRSQSNNKSAQSWKLAKCHYLGERPSGSNLSGSFFHFPGQQCPLWVKSGLSSQYNCLSALLPKADMPRVRNHVRSVPEADVRARRGGLIPLTSTTERDKGRREHALIPFLDFRRARAMGGALRSRASLSQNGETDDGMDGVNTPMRLLPASLA